MSEQEEVLEGTDSLNKKSVWWVVLKIVLSVTAIFIAVRMVSSAEIMKEISSVDPILFLACIILYTLSQLISSERLRLFMQKFRAGHHVTSLWNTQLYFIGMAYNLFLPGGVGGDAYKVILYRKRLKTGTKKILSAVILDRVLGLLSIFLVMGLFGLFFSDMNFIFGKVWIVPAIGLIYFFYVLVGRNYPRFVGVIPQAVVYSVIIQALQIGAFLILVRSTSYIAYSIPFAVAFLISSVATAIPVFLGGIGAREMAFVALASTFDFDPSSAVAASILFSVAVVITSIPGLFLDWFRNDKKRKV